MSRGKAHLQWFVVEQKKGGKVWRRMRGSTGAKEDSTRYMNGVRKSFGDRFNYKLRREYV
jgi:hypothetical protein